MTRDEAVAEVLRGLEFRRSDAGVVLTMQEVQRDLEMGKTLPWFLLEEAMILVGTADDPEVALPADWLRFSEDDPPTAYNADAELIAELEKGEYNQLRNVWTGSTRVRPLAYSIRKSTLWVFPTPSTVWSVRGSYYKKDALLTSNIENEWLEFAPNVIIAKTGLKMAADLQMPKAIAKFQALEMRSQTALLNETIEREMQGQTYAMGSNR